MTNPPPSKAPEANNPRRVIFTVLPVTALNALSTHPLRQSDGGTDALVAATTTQVGDGPIDVFIGGFRIVFEQRGNRHLHARLAVPALRHLFFYPRQLHRVGVFRGSQRFDGGHALSGRGLNGKHARTHRFTVQVNGAGPQAEIPQPNLVPLRFSSSRSTQSNGIPAQYPVTPRPLTRMVSMHGPLITANNIRYHRIPSVQEIKLFDTANEKSLFRVCSDRYFSTVRLTSEIQRRWFRQIGAVFPSDGLAGVGFTSLSIR